MPDYPPISRFPYPLRLAIQDEKKPTHFYGEAVNLARARKRSVDKTNVRWLVQRLLRKLEAL